MDYPWTHNSSRPQKLYRVYRPYQHTSLSPFGLQASTINVFHYMATDYGTFIDSLTAHRNQARNQPSPYISFFSSLMEAESWALAAEDEFHKPAYILEIDLKHPKMKNRILWKVSDIQEKTGKPLGLGGMRNSEWLVLYFVPEQAIRRFFKSSADIRIGKFSFSLPHL
jgi:hypothetical protein